MKQFYSVIINGRFLTQKMTGVHRYAYEMCCALKRAGFDFLVLAPNKIRPEYDICFNIRVCGKLSSHLWEQFELPMYLNKNHQGSLLVSFTGLGSIFYKKTICTIHDISYLVHPEWFSKSYYFLYKWLTPISAKRALKIITVSEFSKKEIVEKLGVNPNKIEIVYNAVTAKLNLGFIEKKEKDNYILTVSSLDPRKNFKRLIQAFNLIDRKDYKIYIIGKKDRVFSDIDFEGLEKNKNIIFTGYVTDERLAQFYNEASLFVYPSLYEGFGIPNLEAMMSNCPVVVSNIPPHKEVCGEAAIYFDPYDIDDIAEKMVYVLDSKDVQLEMQAKGRERVNLFSWNKSAQKLITIIDELL